MDQENSYHSLASSRTSFGTVVPAKNCLFAPRRPTNHEDGSDSADDFSSNGAPRARLVISVGNVEILAIGSLLELRVNGALVMSLNDGSHSKARAGALQLG